MPCSRSVVVALASAVFATAIPVRVPPRPHRPVISIAFALPVMLVGVDESSVSSLFLPLSLWAVAPTSCFPTRNGLTLTERMLEQHPIRKHLTLFGSPAIGCPPLPQCALSGPRHLAGGKTAELENVLTNLLENGFSLWCLLAWELVLNSFGSALFLSSLTNKSRGYGAMTCVGFLEVSKFTYHTAQHTLLFRFSTGLLLCSC